MAQDETTKVLLTRMQLDPSAWRTTYKEIQSTMKTADVETQKRYRDNLNSMKQDLTLSQSIAAHKLTAEKEIVGSLQKQLDVIKRTHATSAQDARDRAVKSSALRKELAIQEKQYLLEVQTTKQIKTQIEALRLASSIRGGPSVGGAGGGLGAMFQNAMRGGMSGMLGPVMGGTILGEVAFHGIESMYEKVKAMKAELIGAAEEASNEAQQMRTLSSAMGGSREKAQEFIEGLHKATLGMVDEGKLMQMAIVGMRASAKLSQEQIIELTAASVKLAVSLHGGQGVSMALNGVTRAMETGRAQALAYAIGLSRQEMMGERAVRGLGRIASANEQFMHTFDLIIAKAKALPEPLMTVSMAIQAESVAHEEFYHKILRIIETSPQLSAVFTAMAEMWSDASKYIDKNSKQIGKAVDAVADSFVSSVVIMIDVVQALTLAAAHLIKLVPAIKGIVADEEVTLFNQKSAYLQSGKVGSLLGPIAGGFGGATENPWITRMKSLSPAQRQKEAEAISRQRDFGPTSATGRSITAHGEFDTLGQTGDTLWNALEKTKTDLAALALKTRGKDVPGGPGTKTPGDSSVAEMVADKRIANEKLEAKTLEDSQKKALALQMSALENAHKMGMADEEYAAKKIALDQQVRDVEIAGAVKVWELDNELASKSNQSAALKALAHKKAQDEFLATASKADEEYRTKKQALDFQSIDLEVARNKEALAQEIQNRKDYLEQTKTLAEEEYSAGVISLDKRLAAEKSYYRQSASLIVDQYFSSAALAGKTPIEQAKIQDQGRRALAALRRQRMSSGAKGNREALALRLQTAQEAVSQAQANLSEGKALGQDQRFSPIQVQAVVKPLMEALRTAGQNYLNELIRQKNGLSTNGLSVDENSKHFIDLSKQIVEATKALDHFKRDLATQATTFSMIITGIAGVVAGMRAGAGPSGIIGAIGGMLTPQGQQANTVQDFFKGNVTNPDGSDASTSKEKVAAGMQVLQSAVAGATTLASAIGNPNMTVGQSTMAGLSGGAQLGSIFGPWGTAIGGAIGGMVGFISGTFMKASRHIAEDVTNAVTKITRNFQDGSATLGQTLTDLENERSQAIAQLSGIKGGQAQLDKILPGLNEQIAQLKLQQRQAINAFEQGLDVKALDINIQSTAQQIQQLVTAWKQYIDAGGDVTKANKQLELSFSQLENVTVNQLNKDYEDALQNAIDYNKALLDRQQIIYQEAQSERDILNQGVLIRTRSIAQTKMSQIAQMRLAEQKQLEQVNQQIALEKYKMDVESKIFNLTGDRLTLEAELVQAKYHEIDLDMARIAAEQNLISQYQSLGTGVGTFSASFLSTFLASIFANMPGVGLSGIPGMPQPAPPGSTALENAASQYYTRMGRFGQYATNPNL